MKCFLIPESINVDIPQSCCPHRGMKCFYEYTEKQVEAMLLLSP